MESLTKLQEKALKDIIESNREILALLNDIEEKRRLQAAPFQATESQTEAITQEDNNTKDKTNLLDNQCQSPHTLTSIADNTHGQTIVGQTPKTNGISKSASESQSEAITQEENNTKDNTNILDNQCQSPETQTFPADNTHGQTNDGHAPKTNRAQSIGSKTILAAPKLNGKTSYKHESDKNSKQTVTGPSRDTKAEFRTVSGAPNHVESSNRVSEKTEQTPGRRPPSDGKSKGHPIINRERSSNKTQHGQVKEENSDSTTLHQHNSDNSGKENTVQKHSAKSTKEEIFHENGAESSKIDQTFDISDNTDETLIVPDLSVVLQDPLYVRKRDGFRRKKTSAAHDNRLLIYLNIKSSSKLDEKAEVKSGKRGNTDLIELDASNKRHKKRLLIENKRATIHIDRWSDFANQEMRKGRIARELRHDGPDTIFCLDTSSSMKGQAIVKAKWFIETHISELQVMTNTDGNYEHVALVTFGKQTKVQKHLTYEYFEILSALDCVRLEGPSPMYAGLKMCMAAILGAGKVSSPPDGSSHTKIYLLTDGRVTLSEFVAGPDSCTETEESKEQKRVMSYCIDLYQKYHLNINTVGVGDCNQSFLESIAKNTGGEFIVVKEETMQENTVEAITPHTELATSPVESTVLEDDTSLKNSFELHQENHRLKMEEIEQFMLEDNERRRRMRDMYGDPFSYSVEAPSSNDSSDNEDTGYSLPHVGARIRIRGNPLCGTVTQQLRNGVRIVWDQRSERGFHSEDISGADIDCLEVVKEPRVLTNELIAVGCRVKRGPDWRYTDQDVYPGNHGTVVKVEDSGIVSVAWDNGPVYTYRYGADVKFEVELLDNRRDHRRPIGCVLDVSRARSGMKFYLTATHSIQLDRLGLTKKRPTDETASSPEAGIEGASNTSHIPESSVTGEEATNSHGITNKGSYNWRWKDGQDKWKDFPDDITDMIEESYQSNKKGSVHIILQDKQYKILFSRMVQIEVNTRTKYPVSRTFTPDSS